MIATIPDELLMALADGELEGALAARVRQAMRFDAGARRRYAAFVTTRPLGETAFRTILAEPVPARLTRAVTGFRRQQAVAASSTPPDRAATPDAAFARGQSGSHRGC